MIMMGWGDFLSVRWFWIFLKNGRNVSSCLNKGETTEIKDFLMSSTEMIDFL